MQDHQLSDLHPRLRDLIRIYQAARSTDDGERCLVAPSPDLRDEIKAQLSELRAAARGRVADLLQIRDRTSPGLNDGLIYPGQLFPPGTPLAVARSAAARRAPLAGDVRVAVILVDFDDTNLGETREHYEELFFSEGVLANGSVREYFDEVTAGKVRIVGDVIGPYRLPRDLSEYANGDSGTGAALPNARTMARDAAVAANPEIDFGPYDNDSDGFVDAFVVVHAGPGAEVTGSPDHIWSHKWVLSGGAFNADGTNIFAYLTVPEDCRIGVCCHELGHLVFGFPDLYDTDYSSEGVGNWCLMGGGSWNGGGDVPAHPCAWCKADQDWADVVNQDTNATVDIEAVRDGNKVYRLWKEGQASTEYFLVENRQRDGYDSELPGDGLLIWHVDETIASNSDENHPKVALLQADGQRDLEKGSNRGDGGDPYPGDSDNTTFNDSSTPSSKSYAGSTTDVGVTQIGASGPSIQARLSVRPQIVKPKERIKEIIDKRKDFKEKDFKDFKEKDFKERKEFKELKEKDFKELKEKDKDAEFPFSPGVDPAAGGIGSALGSDLESRVAALEARLGGAQPFIGSDLRPDLRASALSYEDDQAEAASPRPSKRLLDSPY